ncbi:hypothetical protein C0Q70_19397 [Pomacea canaliculata]|uniref:Protein kinase domain-containing protein n=1 Tax=Pomacea canaliculata TaxID=400727 RepID=A0A2T7NJA0_POMCA|nr:hypothetical protein C0Q70_19397 [Pomacea canaliculata]
MEGQTCSRGQKGSFYWDAQLQPSQHLATVYPHGSQQSIKNDLELQDNRETDDFNLTQKNFSTSETNVLCSEFTLKLEQGTVPASHKMVVEERGTKDKYEGTESRGKEHRGTKEDEAVTRGRQIFQRLGPSFPLLDSRESRWLPVANVEFCHSSRPARSAANGPAKASCSTGPQLYPPSRTSRGGSHRTRPIRQAFFLLMELAEGGRLTDLLTRFGRLPEVNVRFYAAQIFIALSFLHEQNILHRDLKLDNVLLDGAGFIRLCDFGLSVDGFQDDGLVNSPCGTFVYVAPEVFRNSYGKAADWWSYGVLLYLMATGRMPYLLSHILTALQLPFGGKNIKELFVAITRREPFYDSFLSSALVSLLKRVNVDSITC